jgi:hypothetical protein
MRKPSGTSFAIAGIAVLAVAMIAVAGGRPFGERRPAGTAAKAPGADEKGMWLVAGPFAASGLSGLADPLDLDYLSREGLSASGEGGAAPLSVGAGSGAPWREVAGESLPGGARGLDFNAVFGRTIDSVAYAYCEVEARAAGEALLLLGSDDGVKLWINGDLVLANHVRRALLPGEDALAVRLEKGRNRVLAKVEQARGEWGLSLAFVPISSAKALVGSAEPERIEVHPDSRSFPIGKTLCGTVLVKPASAAGGAEARAEVELMDASGKVRARAATGAGGRFSISPPAGLSGPCRFRARGLASLAGLDAPIASAIVGDPSSGAARAAALARSPSAAATAASRYPELPDPAATLEFLAHGVEGSLPSSIVDFDRSIQALQEIEALVGDASSGGSFPIGLWRYAFRSGLDGSVQPYSMYLPAGYHPGGGYGLVVGLHGASQGDVESAARLAASAPPDLVILAPYCRGDQAYAGTGERDALDSIDLVASRYAIDTDRVYLCGTSMGGYGTWRLAKLYPRRFAAAAPFAGWTELDMLENLIGTPLLVVHGDEDPTIPIDPDKRAVEFLKDNGGRVRFDVISGGGHDAFGDWTAKEGPDRLFAWFRRHRRDPWPAKVQARTNMARAGRSAWAAILGSQEPPRMSALDARVVDERHVLVETDNVSAFELDLRHPRLAKGGRILVLADGVNLTADSGAAGARFALGADGRFAAAPALAEGVPPNGGSGLIALFDSPLRIVYGTKKRGAEKAGGMIADAIAEDMGRADIGSVDILRDSEAAATAPDPKTNRILIGNPDENSAAAAIASELPIAWKDGRFASPDGKASGAGLLLVCPDPENPGRLLGLIALPARRDAAANFARGVFASLALQSSVGPCGYGTPDAAILNARLEAEWTGYFDWSWERLAERAAAK